MLPVRMSIGRPLRFLCVTACEDAAAFECLHIVEAAAVPTRSVGVYVAHLD
jgi:hypothetical protein